MNPQLDEVIISKIKTLVSLYREYKEDTGNSELITAMERMKKDIDILSFSNQMEAFMTASGLDNIVVPKSNIIH